MKIRQRFLDIKDGTKFWWLPWFPAKNYPPQTFQPPVYVTVHYPKRKEMAREKECFKFSQFIHLDTHEMWVEWYLEVLVPTGATASLKSHSYLYNLAINNEIFV